MRLVHSRASSLGNLNFMKTMDPVFVGYFPFRPDPVPDGLHLPGVEVICSVSHCIAEVPGNWIDHWTHNDLGFYDTRSAAREVACADGGVFEIFGYRVFPVRISDSAVEHFDVPVAPAENLDGFVLLGIDLVTRSACSFFECSPLSCNGGAEEFRVNKYCLIEDLTYALDVGVRMEESNYEPGPYHLIEVWRAR